MVNPFDRNPFDRPAGPVDQTYREATPFAATPRGVALNTVFGLPSAALKVGKEIGQQVLRSYITLGNTLIGSVNQDPNRKRYQVPEYLRPLVGAASIDDLPTQISDIDAYIKTSETAKKYGFDKFSGPLAIGAVLGQSLLDYSPWGGEKKLVTQLAKETDELAIGGILRQMGTPEKVADKFAGDIAQAKTEDQVRPILQAIKGMATMETAARASADNAVSKITKELSQAPTPEARLSILDSAGINAAEKGIDVTKLGRTDIMRIAQEVKAKAGIDDTIRTTDIVRSSEPSVSLSKKEPETYRNRDGESNEFPAYNILDGGGKVIGSVAASKGKDGRLYVGHIQIDEGARGVGKGTQAIQKLVDDTGAEGVVPLVNENKSFWDKVENLKPNGRNILDEKEIVPNELAPLAESVGKYTKEASRKRIEDAAAAQKKTPGDELIAAMSNPRDGKSWQSLIKGYAEGRPENAKMNIFDYLSTPEFVLERIGLAKASRLLHEAQELRRKNLDKEIERIQGWVKRTPAPGASMRIFRYLDGDARDAKQYMSDAEVDVAREIKTYLKEWADRLKLPEDARLTNYITHLFERKVDKPGENPFDDPDLREMLDMQIAKSVYNPFLEKRAGKKGYKEDAWLALQAYVKRGTRKEVMDPVLEEIETMGRQLPEDAFRYVKRLIDRNNLRPTEFDQLVDKTLTSVPGIGYRFTDRPTTVLSRKIRTIFYRGTLGLNVGSALRNLSQGANTYAKLGEKYTIYGYTKLLGRLVSNNLDDLYEKGILANTALEDKKIGVLKKGLDKLDPVLWSMFDLAEKINRGAAYYGALARGVDKGLSTSEAEKYAERLVRETQFTFGNVDSPLALSSDTVKTIAQLQSYNVKQIEFLTRMLKNKEYDGLIRYTVSALAFVYSIGRLFGMKPEQLIPSVGLEAPSTNLATAFTDYLTAGSDREREEAKKKGLRSVVSVIPGGAQLRKTIEGLNVYAKGRDETAAGRLRYRVKQTPDNLLRAGLFGKSSLPAAQEYNDRVLNPSRQKEKESSGSNPLNR